MSDPTLRTRAFRAVQYLLGAVALVWVVRQVEWDRVVALFVDVSLGTVAALMVVSAVGLLTALWMWYILLNAVQETRLRDAAGMGLIVLFVNHLLPSRLSGRAVAPFVAHEKTGMNYSDAVAVSGVHTGLYALLYGLTALLGLTFGGGRLPVELAFVLLLSAGLYVAAGTLVLLAGFHLPAVDRISAWVESVARHLPLAEDRFSALAETFPSFTGATATTFRGLSGDTSAVTLYTAGFVISTLVAPGLRVWILLETLGVRFDPAILLPIYLVTAYSVTLLPLTPGGIGVTEATATAVFVALGVPSEIVVPVVFADRLLGTYFPALIGWYPSLRVDISELISGPSARD